MLSMGDKVKVYFPPSDKFNNPAKKLQGQEFVVKSRKYMYKGKTNGHCFYQLYGAESDMGVPYTFLEEELIRITDK